MKNGGIEMKYTPNPMQTDDLVALTELIAANVHDVWADRRIKEGWTYSINILDCLTSNCYNYNWT